MIYDASFIYLQCVYVENADGRSTSKSVLSYGRTDGIRSWVTMERGKGGTMRKNGYRA